MSRTRLEKAAAAPMEAPPPFAFIESVHGEAAYGRVLDAGTGPRSLRWLMSLDTESCTAVTGDAAFADRVERMMGDWKRPQDRMVVGNWADPQLLAGEQFDTVLADHLLGAIEGFAPYFQTRLLERLRSLTAKRLYFTGMEPYVVERPDDEGAALLWEIGRYRDSCLILAGHRPYREYPLEWVESELRRSRFELIASHSFAVGYEAKFVNKQIIYCRARLERLADRSLAQSLLAHGEELRGRALAHIESHGRLARSHYVIAAHPF